MRTAGFNPDDYPDMLTVKQAAEFVGVHQNTIRKWCRLRRHGLRPPARPTPHRILRADLLAILDKIRTKCGTMSTMTLLQVNDAMVVLAELLDQPVEKIEAEFHALEDLRYLEIVHLTGRALLDYCADGEKPLEAHLRIAHAEPESLTGKVLAGLLIGRPYRRCWYCDARQSMIRDRPLDTRDVQREVEHARPYRIRGERYKCRTCGEEFPVLELVEPTD
jgi:transposase-like protein/DNA-directed RNA polymerase subunit RPC12/RpoP